MHKIAVIGCGVIGLTSALEIQKKLGPFAQITIFSEQLSPHTTGDVAAGLWMPYLVQNTPEKQIVKWAKTTYDFILNLWKKGEAKKYGISLQLLIELSKDKEFIVPQWVEVTLGHTILARKELDYYEKIYNEEFTAGITYMTFIFEASKFLPIFQKKFQQNGGRIIIRKIHSFDEIKQDFDVIVNCTGLQSKFLVKDEEVRPIRGQICRVKAPWQFHTLIIDDFYVIPNQNWVVLGGTHQENDFNETIDEQDRKRIVEGCFRYIPTLSKAVFIENRVGLRPGRSQIRLEIELLGNGGKVVPVVHNYGHGGSGVTLSMGCAEEVAQMVQDALGLKISKL